jgi:hypothetical protein
MPHPEPFRTSSAIQLESLLRWQCSASPADLHHAGKSLCNAAAEADNERLAVERFELEALEFEKR